MRWRPSVAETDWQRIVILYEALGRLTPSPVIELNRAVAVAMASGPAAGLALVDAIAASGELAGFASAARDPRRVAQPAGPSRGGTKRVAAAAELCSNAAERAVLERKVSELGDAASEFGQSFDGFQR